MKKFLRKQELPTKAEEIDTQNEKANKDRKDKTRLMVNTVKEHISETALLALLLRKRT